MDFMGAIATATKAIEGLKLLMSLEKTFDEATFKLRSPSQSKIRLWCKALDTKSRAEETRRECRFVLDAKKWMGA
jgi:hypothetical protein